MSEHAEEYTWAPQTVHNTPVVNILKGYFVLYFSKRNQHEILNFS